MKNEDISISILAFEDGIASTVISSLEIFQYANRLLERVHQKDVDNSKGVIGLLLSGLGAVKPVQEAGSATALGRRPWMAVENEFNDRLIMPTQIWCPRWKTSTRK